MQKHIYIYIHIISLSLYIWLRAETLLEIVSNPWVCAGGYAPASIGPEKCGISPGPARGLWEQSGYAPGYAPPCSAAPLQNGSRCPDRGIRGQSRGIRFCLLCAGLCAIYIYSISELMILLCAGLCAIYIWPKRVADDTMPIFLLKGLCTEPYIYI